MSILRNIRLDDGRRFYLCDDTAKNDDRTVEDENDRVYLVFDHSLHITKPAGFTTEHVGQIWSAGTRWKFRQSEATHDLGPTNGHDWRALMDAEVAAAKIILPTLDKG